MKFSIRKLFILKFTIFVFFLEIINVNNAKVKNISFLKDFLEAKSNKQKFFENYIKHFENLTRDNNLTFKRVKIYEREAFQPYLKEKQDITEQGLKLFRINKKFVISLDNIKKSDEYNLFFQYIKTESK
jgi:hypothetical protein